MNKINQVLSLFRCILFVSILFLASCSPKSKEIDEVALMGYDYYPIKKGNYIVYQVNYSVTPDTNLTYQIMEVVADTLKVGDDIQYKLERYRRENQSEPWSTFPTEVWTVSIKDNRILKVEENIRFVKLVFPLKEGNTWNGNAYNTEVPINYRLKEIGRPYDKFSETLKVIQGSGDSSLVKKNTRLEVFAKNVGLIYKQYDNFLYEQGEELGKYKRGNGSTRYIERCLENGTL